MKAIGYIRVSTADQSNSLEVQTEKIINYCKFKNILLMDIFTDEDVSGGKPFYNREGGSNANSKLINSDVKTIICVKPDRLFRNVKDALITVDDWEQNNISLHIIDMGGNSIDTQTAMGRMFFIQSISMAGFERKITSERTKAVLSHKKKSGKSYCGSMYGFDNVDGNMVVNESELFIVKWLFLKKDEWSFRKIANALNVDGYKSKRGGKFHASTIKAILDNPIYKQYI